MARDHAPKFRDQTRAQLYRNALVCCLIVNALGIAYFLMPSRHTMESAWVRRALDGAPAPEALPEADSEPIQLSTPEVSHVAPIIAAPAQAPVVADPDPVPEPIPVSFAPATNDMPSSASKSVTNKQKDMSAKGYFEMSKQEEDTILSQLQFHGKGTAPLVSRQHCFGKDSEFPDRQSTWLQTTCAFKNLCYNVRRKKFLYFKDASETAHKVVNVSLAPFNTAWNQQWDHIIRFSPELVQGSLQEAYYSASEDDFWLPYMSLTFTIQRLTGMNDKVLRPLRVAEMEDPMWATCDWIKKNDGKTLPRGYFQRCASSRKWLQAMVTRPVPTTEDFLQTLLKSKALKSDIVCFPNAAAGLGVLSDHCLKDHGQRGDFKQNRQLPQCNLARGAEIFEFRSRVLSNFGLDPSKKPSKLKVVVAQNTNGGTRRMSFVKLLNALAQRQKSAGFEVKAYKFASMSPAEQLRVASEAAVYVTAVGGGSVTGMFVPRGAGVILVHLPGELLDKDFWNQASYLRAQFFDVAASQDVEAMTAAVLHQLENARIFGLLS